MLFALNVTEEERSKLEEIKQVYKPTLAQERILESFYYKQIHTFTSGEHRRFVGVYRIVDETGKIVRDCSSLDRSYENAYKRWLKEISAKCRYNISSSSIKIAEKESKAKIIADFVKNNYEEELLNTEFLTSEQKERFLKIRPTYLSVFKDNLYEYKKLYQSIQTGKDDSGSVVRVSLMNVMVDVGLVYCTSYPSQKDFQLTRMGLIYVRDRYGKSDNGDDVRQELIKARDILVAKKSSEYLAKVSNESALIDYINSPNFDIDHEIEFLKMRTIEDVIGFYKTKTCLMDSIRLRSQFIQMFDLMEKPPNAMDGLPIIRAIYEDGILKSCEFWFKFIPKSILDKFPPDIVIRWNRSEEKYLIDMSIHHFSLSEVSVYSNMLRFIDKRFG